jgi:hypothetical protein
MIPPQAPTGVGVLLFFRLFVKSPDGVDAGSGQI